MDGLAVQGEGWQQDLSLAQPLLPHSQGSGPRSRPGDMAGHGHWPAITAMDPKSSSSGSPRVTWKGWSK